jgi:ABC-type transport system involved in multi-copper enzyme maturation permease subunit
MTATTTRTPTTPYRSTVAAGRDGFAQLVRGEWTKFRTVRGWVIATAAATLVMVAFGILVGSGSHSVVSTSAHPNGVPGHPYVPIGPDGEAVSDGFYFLHQALAGDGSITTRVSSLTGGTVSPGAGAPTASLGSSTPTSGGIQPWAKAGLIIKANTSQGSGYAAIMVTGGHGVRMQYDYTGDIAGPAGSAATVSAASPRWLRLTRTGDTVVGSASTDGTTWTGVGTVRLRGLPATVAAGMFAASPGQAVTINESLGAGSAGRSRTAATATFDTPVVDGNWPAQAWRGVAIGSRSASPGAGGFQQVANGYTVTGSGDIAPDVGEAGSAPEHTLAGAFAMLAVVVVLAVLFISTEYRRGLIRTTLTLSPRRGRALAAKAVVIGAVTFVTGLVAAAITVPIGEHFLRVNGNFVYPITALTQVRIVAGTAALLAVAAVLALAVGTILRRSAGAVAAVIVLVVLPYILGTAGVLPAGPAQWLLRITPAAAFAVQQTLPAYPQVDLAYTPFNGFYPLPSWAGFAVLCAWTAVALGTAMYLLRRRDA